MNSRISVVKCADYQPDKVERALRNAIGLIGGISCFVKPQSRVLVKPNLLMSKAPECGITTHPEVVRSVIHILKELDCKVVVGDGPSVWSRYGENPQEVYEATGITKVCREEGVELNDFKKRRMRKKFPLTALLDECDHLISLPKFKTHGLTLISGAIKNLFGLVSGTFKTELHKNYFDPEEFAGILVDIYQEAQPALTIIDAITAIEGDGPAASGKLRQLGLLMAGADCVALDSVMAKIMGIKGQDVLSTKEASSRGLGESRLSSIKIEGEDVDRLNIRPFALPQASLKKTLLLPKPLQMLVKSLIKYYPYWLGAKCSRCGHCVGICPGKCIKISKNMLQFDYKRCISCFCCQEICPEAAIAVKKSILARAIGL